MRPFVVTLERPRLQKPSLDETKERTRSIVERFRAALAHVVKTEGLTTDLGEIEPTQNLPILFVTGTDRLAERISEMSGVRSVSRDAALHFQLGERSPR